MYFDFNLMEGIKKAMQMTSEQREKLLEEADRKIPNPQFDVFDFITGLCYDKSFCKSVGIDYCRISEADSRIMKTGLALSLMH